jgi:hypothetical protein
MFVANEAFPEIFSVKEVFQISFFGERFLAKRFFE